MNGKKIGILAIGMCLLMIAASFSGCVETETKTEIKNPDTIVYYTIGDPKTLYHMHQQDQASLGLQ